MDDKCNAMPVSAALAGRVARDAYTIGSVS
jgi:hypothetical protein